MFPQSAGPACLSPLALRTSAQFAIQLDRPRLLIAAFCMTAVKKKAQATDSIFCLLHRGWTSGERAQCRGLRIEGFHPAIL